MSTRPSIAVVGGGLAGGRAIETLRREGFAGPITLVGEELWPPYERPPLSKELLQGRATADDAFVQPAPWYEEHEVEWLPGTRATAIETAERVLLLDDGRRVRYDDLLLATGAAPRPLPVPGADLPGVHLLRTLDDAVRLRDALGASARVVVIGAGWIGTEVAASARARGCEVTLVGRGAVPLERVLGAEVGAFFRDLHADHGVELRMNADVASIEGTDHVDHVRLRDGQRIECDVVVVGVGAAPRTELAQAAGLAVDGGVATDERLRTSEAGIYAAGDVAAAWHPIFGRRIRVEHWANAGHQGRTAALNILGRNEVHDRIPYFFSDQFDVGLEYSGDVPAGSEVVFRGDPKSRAFMVFWLRDERVVAGMSVNVWDVAEAVQALVRARRPVDRARLTDPDVALDDPARVAA